MRSTNLRFAIPLATFTLALTLSVTGCESAQNGGSSPAAVPASPDAPADPRPETSPDIVVDAEGSRIRQFGLPSLRDFMSDPYITDVVYGVVQNTRTIVTGDALQVETISEVKVLSGRHRLPGDVIIVREAGGVVPLAQVRADFEGKDQRPLTEEDLGRTVDYTYEGAEHPQLGETSLFALTNAGGDDYGSVLRLVTVAGALRWPGTPPPNPQWDESYDLSAMADLMQ